MDLEDGIYGLIVTLCQQKTPQVGAEAAKAEVAAWLVQIASTLTTTPNTTEENTA